MTDRDFARGRGGQMGWRNQGNGVRGQFGPEDQFGAEGYGGRRQFSGWEGNYGPSPGYGEPEYGRPGWDDQGESWRQGQSRESWEHGHSGRGFWGQGHPAGVNQEFGSRGGGQFGQGFDHPGGWRGSGGGSWEQGFGGSPGPGGYNQFGSQGFAARGGSVTGSGYEQSWSIPGPYSGRGPRGYQRSDARIEEDICERFTQHGQLDASDIQVVVAKGEVTLTGTVESRQAKRLAEDILDAVSGVKDVHNQLRVQQASGQSDWSQTGTETARTQSRNQSGRNAKAMAGAARS